MLRRVAKLSSLRPYPSTKISPLSYSISNDVRLYSYVAKPHLGLPNSPLISAGFPQLSCPQALVLSRSPTRSSSSSEQNKASAPGPRVATDYLIEPETRTQQMLGVVGLVLLLTALIRSSSWQRCVKKEQEEEERRLKEIQNAAESLLSSEHKANSPNQNESAGEDEIEMEDDEVEMEDEDENENEQNEDALLLSENERRNVGGIERVTDFQVKDLNGNPVSLNQFSGQVLLVCNIASKWGTTDYQLKSLEALQRKYEKDGFCVLAFPSNSFNQEFPTNQQILSFLQTNYSISFPVFSQVLVNGEESEPLFEYLKERSRGVVGTKQIKWNFTKFLVDRNGVPVKRYGVQVDPLEIENDPLFKQLLSEPTPVTRSQTEQPNTK